MLWAEVQVWLLVAATWAAPPEVTAGVQGELARRMDVNPCGPSTDTACLCRLLCDGAWPNRELVRLTWPFGASGGTGDPTVALVPLGSAVVLELGADGRATACGRVELPGGTAPVCEVPPPAGVRAP